jgi:hypothetical protein
MGLWILSSGGPFPSSSIRPVLISIGPNWDLWMLSTRGLMPGNEKRMKLCYETTVILEEQDDPLDMLLLHL